MFFACNTFKDRGANLQGGKRRAGREWWIMGGGRQGETEAEKEGPGEEGGWGREWFCC